MNSKHKILLDCQHGATAEQSEELGAISEEFFTIFANRDLKTGEGFDLRINNEYNPIVGDLFSPKDLNPHWIDLDIDDLINLMKMGFTKYGAAYLLGISAPTIERRIKSISGKSYEEFQVDIIEPIITAMVEDGYSGEEIARHFVRFDIDQKLIFTVKKARQAALIGAPKVINYNPQSMETFLKPVILEFIKRGMTLDEIAAELKDLKIINLNRRFYSSNALKQCIPRLFEGRSLEKMRQIYLEPIIENLLRTKDSDGNYLGAFKIVVKLGWCAETDSRDIKQSMSDRLMGFIKARWGFKRITDARNFFIDHYLGYHEYDYFYLG